MNRGPSLQDPHQSQEEPCLGRNLHFSSSDTNSKWLTTFLYITSLFYLSLSIYHLSICLSIYLPIYHISIHPCNPVYLSSSIFKVPSRRASQGPVLCAWHLGRLGVQLSGGKRAWGGAGSRVAWAAVTNEKCTQRSAGGGLPHPRWRALLFPTFRPE